MEPQTQKVTVIAPNWIGDAVMSLPAVNRLGEVRGITVSVMAPSYTARVYAGCRAVDELIVDGNGSSRSRRVLRRARALRAVGADAALVFPPSFSSALSPFLARVPVRVGYASDARGALLSDAPRPPDRGSAHLSVGYLDLAARSIERLAGPAPSSRVPSPSLAVFESDVAEADAIRGELDGEGEGYIVIAPGVEYGPAKSWPLNRFRGVAEALCEVVSVVLVGGARERETCDGLAGGLRGVHNAAGRTSLGGLFALVEGARVVLANDSGTAHVAAALGVPVVVVFGSTDPEWTRPIGERVVVVRKPVSCAPCFRRDCPTELECFTGISVNEVVDHARRAMDGDVARVAATKKGVAEIPPGR